MTIHTGFANAIDAAMRTKRISNEALAELCNLSRNSISAYRSGDSLPGEEAMLLIMEKLDAPWLGWIWLRSNRVGAELLPDVPLRELSASYCDLQVELDDANGLQRDMALICRDNRIDDAEQSTWAKCRKELTELITSAFSLLLAPMQKEKSPVVAHRR